MADSTPTPTPTPKTYKGNCHCGAFKFSLNMPEEIKSVMECDCSHCFRQGFMWVFPPKDAFVVERGEEGLKGYEFGGRSMGYKFCGVCGTPVYAKRHNAPEGQNLGINVRMLQDVDLWALEVNKYEGSKMPPAYEPAVYKGPEPPAKIDGAKVYTGSCHCGAVTMALKTKGKLSGESESVQECNCSICSRNGTIMIYPQTEQVHVENKEGLTSYVFGKKTQSHEFCKKCGVSVWIRQLDEKDPEWENTRPVNLRCFEGVEWEGIEVKKNDWKDVGEKYEVE